MEIRPITFKQASDFINKNHRHHKATVGHKFSIGLYDKDKIIGCAVCGRPVSRYLDDGLTCEINRLCTDGTKNACSKLYGACCRVAGGTHWTGKRFKNQNIPAELKTRWVKDL